ncbi:Aryl-phospho-beta-D-glucosidase BglC, GH1 family [Mucilaginibacter mallensis]|uniref:Aryl-phospho-beta-D-glucosidase BglC, GH1 family n=1 Tax=Mucilaginibacter mallensis TaxID=652787 RepID=A0A1H2AEJ8_MUCMA|nr:cellulase family glycosylhydrolase [Mucilaginibacter mallensis]SDT44259.1 Aryl-phospho-beta-D-glucosidase BglC, GH1 family [Mucilaginibacter mallensis]
MKKKYFFKSVVLFTAIITLFACKKAKSPAPELTVSVSTMSFAPDGGTQDITVTSNAAWSVSNPASSWLQLSATSGNSGSTVIHVTATSPNGTGASQSAIFEISASNGQARRVTVTQAPTIYPGYNTSPIAPDMTGVTSNAVQLAAKMGTGMGMNFGNTMDSPNDGDWVSGKITDAQVKFVKKIGFSAVRIPMNWVWTHLSDPKKATIDPVWLARVKQVVGYCVANDVYVIINAHADLGWLENNVNAIKKDSVNAMQKAIWEQIATTLRDFDEHLLFASTNEPAVDNAEQMAILNGYHETFINAVRSTGGRNSYRVLVVQGPHADPTKTATLMTTMPTDPVPNKLILEVHDYTPAQFTLLTDGDASWGNMIYYWGAGNVSTIEPSRNAPPAVNESQITTELQGVKQDFVDKGIPVILGEYAAPRRNNPNEPMPLDTAVSNRSVDYWNTFMTKTAKTDGMLPFFWETGQMLDRANNVVIDQRMYNSLVAGYK